MFYSDRSRFATSLDYWRHMVRCHADGPADKIEEAAQMCAETDAKGWSCGVWHAVHIVHGGTTKTCPCTPCSKARGVKFPGLVS
jgi:hypothetical protein